METKQIIHSLRDKADRAADLSWARIMHTAADRLWVLEHRLNVPDKTVGKWVPVTERLPAEDERVLVWLDASGISYTQIDTDRLHKKKWRRWGKYVTHWMPLPEPPKEVANESET